MKINRIMPYNYSSNNTNCKKYPSFKAYSDVLKKAYTTSIKNDHEAENLFITLFKALCEEQGTQIKNSFLVLKDIYEKSGFRGLLNELWKANPQESVAKIIKDTHDDCEDLVVQNGEPLLTLYNFGKFGFFERKTSPNNVKLAFYGKDQSEVVEFGLSKKGNLLTGQSNGIRSIDNEFYLQTGTKKEEIVNSCGDCEKKHYNKDGSEPFLKNLIFDGTAVQGY